MRWIGAAVGLLVAISSGWHGTNLLYLTTILVTGGLLVGWQLEEGTDER
jgi:hypothetical protein